VIVIRDVIVRLLKGNDLVSQDGNLTISRPMSTATPS
jgi:hypothetical protein